MTKHGLENTIDTFEQDLFYGLADYLEHQPGRCVNFTVDMIFEDFASSFIPVSLYFNQDGDIKVRGIEKSTDEETDMYLSELSIAELVYITTCL